MEIPKPTESDGMAYIGKKTYTDKNVRKITIKTEAKMVETEYNGKTTMKPECIVTTDVQDPAEAIWQMNKATQRYMIEKHGGDSKNWIGKVIEIKLASAGNANASIYPSELSLEKTY